MSKCQTTSQREVEMRQQARAWRMPALLRKVQIANAQTHYRAKLVSICDVTVARLSWADLPLLEQPLAP